MIMLQDVAYQVELPTDGKYDSGCLTNFERYIERGELPQGTYEDTVKTYVKAYIMMLLSAQLFGDNSGTRLHIHWLPYVARLEDMGRYNWGFIAISWLYWCMCCVANRNVVKLAGPLQLL
ncbi:hypothetical protein Ahy_A05g023636 [Arachis hypogaea]|uniref:Aminotransferase-like plant mobile domain-containing protein n=1 Tax=Arachis hypogaea TaxID=3818 RepID=A0A445D436_ARAHY|nr:hypothetical protein Ahy_A05g023636 [Arachis hypogaea]